MGRSHARTPVSLTCATAVATALALMGAPATAGDSATFGGGPERNMTAARAGALPDTWDLKSGKHVRWTADLGTETYGGPIVAGGKVFVGTNNEKPRDAGKKGDHGVLMAFDAATGAFLWQAAHVKLPEGGSQDWPLQGVCSTPHVEGDRLYYVSNRGELVAADTEGFLDGENDGPFTDEPRRGEHDADIVWILDMRTTLGVVPRYMTASAPLVIGDRVFATTSNGPGEDGIPAPAAPSLIAVDRMTGAVAWSDASPGASLKDGQWASPSHGTLAGEEQVLFAGGDGRLYAFAPADGTQRWVFDANAGSEPPGQEAFVASAAIADGRVFIGVGRDPELGAGHGALFALEVETTDGNLAPTVAWSRRGKEFSRTLSTAAVHDGLVYAADLNGFLHGLDAATGQELWSHDTFAAVWASPLVADGKIYLGDEDGDMAVLRTGPKKELLAEINMGDSIYTPAAARDGTLYIATRSRLFALSPAAKQSAPPDSTATAPADPSR